MKKFLAIAVLFICQNVLCQEYYFDTFFEFEILDGATNIIMSNSRTKDYTFFCRNNKSEFKGYIIDYKYGKIHYYTFENKNNTLEFKYLYSENHKFQDKPCNYQIGKYDINKVTIDSLNCSIEIIEYNNKSKKRIDNSSKVYLTKSKKPFAPILTYGLFYDFSKCNFIDFPKDYIPTHIEAYDHYYGNRIITKLIQQKEINTLLSLKPEDIKYN